MSTSHNDAVKIECDSHILEVTLNRPESLNAMNIPLIEGLFQAIEEAKDPEIRAVLIRGEGRGFCAGGDISFFAKRLKEGEGVPREMPDRLHEMVEKLVDLPKPVIAVVHGPAAGAGMSLVLACDFAVAAEAAKFNLAYVGIGLSPDGSSSFFLPRHVGMKKAMEIFMAPRTLTAQEALELGLINRVIPDADLIKESRDFAEKLAQGPTKAFGHIKELVKASFRNNLHDQLTLESDFICSSSATEDFRAGVTAFLAKKTPKFTGK